MKIFSNNLFEIIRNGNIWSLYGYLSTNKYNIDFEDEINQQTPLHISCEYGWLEITQLLIENNADRSARDMVNFITFFL